jgi:hypothetical protein
MIAMANLANARAFPRTVEIDDLTGRSLATRLARVNVERARQGLRPLGPAQFARAVLAQRPDVEPVEPVVVGGGNSTFNGEDGP